MEWPTAFVICFAICAVVCCCEPRIVLLPWLAAIAWAAAVAERKKGAELPPTPPESP